MCYVLAGECGCRGQVSAPVRCSIISAALINRVSRRSKSLAVICISTVAAGIKCRLTLPSTSFLLKQGWTLHSSTLTSCLDLEYIVGLVLTGKFCLLIINSSVTP
jgi:hypothetical protein